MIERPDGPYCENVMVDHNPAPASAVTRLCNFKTSSAVMLPEHKDALRYHFLEAAWVAEGAWVDIVGYASKAGFTNNNWALSQARCFAVKEFVQPYFDHAFRTAHNVHLNVKQGVGDTLSGDDPTRDHNHGFFRAVEVKLFSSGHYEYHPPPVLRRGSAWVSSSKFEFEAIENASVEAGVLKLYSVGSTALIFGIHDLQNSRRRYFGFSGVQGSVAAPKTGPLSASAEHHSLPVPFTTSVPIVEFEDFTGPGMLAGDPGVTMGSYSFGGALTLSWSPKAYRNRGVSTQLTVGFSFSRGFGIGLASMGAGTVSLLPESFRPAVYSR